MLSIDDAAKCCATPLACAHSSQLAVRSSQPHSTLQPFHREILQGQLWALNDCVFPGCALGVLSVVRVVVLVSLLETLELALPLAASPPVPLRAALLSAMHGNSAAELTARGISACKSVGDMAC